MLGSIFEFYHEILTEMATELAVEPMRIIAENIQFAVLMAIVWVVAIGFGKRRGFVANMLSERRERIAARVESASHAEKQLEDSKHSAATTTRTARAKARAIVVEAKKECAEIETTTQAETDAECRRIEERAESALATEQQEMLLELREQLVELVSSATRSIMNEKLTVSEQRTLIENTIVGSMESSASSEARLAALAAGSVPKGA